jgi:indolepyruvate ferredoxin oxidoreductase alpha subunit
MEDLIRACGVKRVFVVEPRIGSGDFEKILDESLASNELSVIIARRPCILIVKQLKKYEQQACECEPKGAHVVQCN